MTTHTRGAVLAVADRLLESFAILLKDRSEIYGLQQNCNLAAAMLRALAPPEQPPAPEPKEMTMLTEKQIKHMVDRFLGWKLPTNFTPDGGISFKPTFNDHLPAPMKREPSGTNLFDADQATAMVRYMAEGLPPENDTVREAERMVIEAAIAWTGGFDAMSSCSCRTCELKRSVKALAAARGAGGGNGN